MTTQPTQSMSSSQLSTDLDNLQDQMNAKEFQLYKYSANASFNQSMAQTLGELGVNSAKAKPEV